jgi:hypothetical protein
MTNNLLSTRSGSFLVLSARANYKNKLDSPVLEATKGLPDIDWSLVDDYKEPETFTEVKAKNRALVSNLAKSREEICTGNAIIEAAQAQIIIQHLHLQTMSLALHEKGNSSTGDRTRVYPDGKGRLLTCPEFVESVEAAAAQRKGEEERRRSGRQRKEERKKALQDLEKRWSGMKIAHEQSLARWKEECAALLQQGVRRRDLPVRPCMPRKPTLPAENEPVTEGSDGGRLDVVADDLRSEDGDGTLDQPNRPDLDM